MYELRSILIIRFGSLGDVLLASPLIRTLRKEYPSASIDFLVKSEYAEVVRFNPHLSSVIELRTSDPAELRALRRQIRQTKYDVILDIHNSLRSRYVRIFAGAKSLRIVDKRAVARYLLVKFKWNTYSNISSVADRYIETARDFGARNDGLGLEIFIPPDVISSVNARLDRFRLDQFDVVVGFVPGARHFTKRWLPERFVELGVRLAKSFRAKVFVVGSKEEKDYCGDIAQLINAQLGKPAAESLAGDLSLLETAALFDHCSAVVANDTGLMHLATARNRKVVAIFGSTVREFGFFPYGTESLVVETAGLRCRPCSHIGRAACPEGHFRCMNDIHVDDVWHSVEQIVGYPSPATS